MRTPKYSFRKNSGDPKDIDHISGLVRRRDLHRALDGMVKTTGNFLGRLFLSLKTQPQTKHLGYCLTTCQLSVVVDEYGSVAGVLAMEDIIESIIGQEYLSMMILRST